ncbi:hypothetical protein FocTR4_00010693 [Fusarium oxysporum f. sp. cubense]|uniref:Uncharacterized protein n=1 Tax=Fusarium oxysporum f. sp. cubense TaxID=61366 RepID=A0A5C6T9C8_FUSOC|nr:hypothetical protein FocTR4_00010693 [Fusarium oxysporum f. sp. cubense]
MMTRVFNASQHRGKLLLAQHMWKLPGSCQDENKPQLKRAQPNSTASARFLGHALSKFEKLALTCIISRITTPHVPPPFAVEPSLTDRHKRYHDDPKVENLDDDDVRVASRLTRSVGAD